MRLPIPTRMHMRIYAKVRTCLGRTWWTLTEHLLSPEQWLGATAFNTIISVIRIVDIKTLEIISEKEWRSEPKPRRELVHEIAQKRKYQQHKQQQRKQQQRQQNLKLVHRLATTNVTPSTTSSKIQSTPKTKNPPRIRKHLDRTRRKTEFSSRVKYTVSAVIVGFYTATVDPSSNSTASK